MSAVTDNLERARAVAWFDLRPAFDHALVVAREAEHEADRAANAVMSHVDPAYPPLVILLAQAAPQ